jgi:hypothetical protein
VRVQGEGMAHQEVAAGVSRGIGGVTGGDATISQGKQEGGATRYNTTTRWRVKRLQRNEKPCKNKLGKWELTAHQEVVLHQ